VTAFAYKKEAENYVKDPANYKFDETVYQELENVSHREYTDGFYFPDGGINQNYKTSSYASGKSYAGYVREINGNKALVSVKATLKIGDVVEVLTPGGSRGNVAVKGIQDNKMIEQTHTKNFEDYLLTVETTAPITPYSILRK
jgi:putative protease